MANYNLKLLLLLRSMAFLSLWKDLFMQFFLSKHSHWFALFTYILERCGIQIPSHAGEKPFPSSVRRSAMDTETTATVLPFLSIFGLDSGFRKNVLVKEE